MFKHDFLQLGKLRNSAKPRSALPPSRATPTGFSRHSRSRDGWAHNRAHRSPLGRRRRPKKKKSHKKQAQDFRKVPIHTHLSLLPAEAALRFRVIVESTAGSSVTRPWTSDAVRLADGPAQNTTFISPKSNSSIKQKSKEKVVRFTIESVCARGASSGSGALL